MQLSACVKNAWLAGLLATASLLLSACTVAPIPIPITVNNAPAMEEEAVTEDVAEVETPQSGPLTLEGVDWQISEYRADGAAVLPTAAASMLFEDGQVSGSTGCNREYRVWIVESLWFGAAP